MSDLISRSALIKAMNESKKQPTSDENIEGYCEGWNDLADIINEQPTAYDVEKVVKELEEERMKLFLTIANTGSEKLDIAYGYASELINKAIDIVRKGGAE
mgnify:CR=1 FL=1